MLEHGGNGRRPDGTFMRGNRAAAGRRTALRTAREVFAKDATRAADILRAMLDDDQRPELQFAAAKLILEYHHGKPVATNVVALPDLQVTDELRASVCESVARFAAQCAALGGDLIAQGSIPDA